MDRFDSRRNMKNKLLISSTFAVIILVVAGISPVIGYNSVKSSALTSPLFNNRTKSVVYGKQDSIISDYLGKNSETNILFPKDDTNRFNYIKIIKNIISMDDDEFNRFLDTFIFYLQNTKSLENKEIIEIKNDFNLLRSNSIEIKGVLESKEFTVYSEESSSICTMGRWYPGCWILSFITLFILIPIVLPILIIMFISNIGV